MESAYSDLFEFHGESGFLYPSKSLNREEQSSYSFEVTVRDDLGKTGLSSTCLVQVVVQDVNDVAPEVVLPRTPLGILENTPPNGVVGKISAVDPDEGRNAEVDFALEDEGAGRQFSIGKIDGVIRSKVTFDREEQDSYNVIVLLADRGSPKLEAKAEITIKIMDENDNIPEFQLQHYSARVFENSSVGSKVLQLDAFDLDEGDNAQLTYTIISGNGNVDFAVDAHTGLIKVNKNLDYERKTFYNLKVQVNDNGSPSANFVTASVTIDIVDVNDNAPIFVDSPYSVQVLENLPPALLLSPIAAIEAVDKDAGAPQNKVEYALREDYGQLFSINSSTGHLYCNEPLDREKIFSYKLDVVATDFGKKAKHFDRYFVHNNMHFVIFFPGSPRLRSIGTVNIEVVDENDNSPIFETCFYKFEVKENTPAQEVFGRVFASDQDVGKNAEIS